MLKIYRLRSASFAEAAEKAVSIWSTAEPVNNEHPYLISKQIKACGVRLYKGILAISTRSSGELCSLQFIDADGSKRFLSGGRVFGCYFSIGTTKAAEVLCIAEGFATGATIHQATLRATAVSMPHLECLLCDIHKKFDFLAWL